MKFISANTAWGILLVARALGAGTTIGCADGDAPALAPISRDAGGDDGSLPDTGAPPDAGGDEAEMGASWAVTGSLQAARSLHTATRLEDGRVLVTGGRLSSSQKTWVAMPSCEIYAPTSHKWSSAAPMASRRWGHTATLINSADKKPKVLVVGGLEGSTSLSSVEIYDPVANTWSLGPPLLTARHYHTATRLEDGRVLVAGGQNNSVIVSGTEIYDPTSNTWTAGAFLAAARYAHTATLLRDGRVLFTGGKDLDGRAMSSGEIDAPSLKDAPKATLMIRARAYHSASLLDDGTVLVAGGWDGSPLSSAERFDPSSLTWSEAAAMASPRYGHTAALFEGDRGKVLIAGGAFLTSAEIYDNQASRWVTTEPMMTAQGFHTATLLEDGSFLLVAGQESSTAVLRTALLFHP